MIKRLFYNLQYDGTTQGEILAGLLLLLSGLGGLLIKMFI